MCIIIRVNEIKKARGFEKDRYSIFYFISRIEKWGIFENQQTGGVDVVDVGPTLKQHYDKFSSSFRLTRNWTISPANTRHSPNVGSMLARRQRRRPNIDPTLVDQHWPNIGWMSRVCWVHAGNKKRRLSAFYIGPAFVTDEHCCQVEQAVTDLHGRMKEANQTGITSKMPGKIRTARLTSPPPPPPHTHTPRYNI